VAQASVLFSSAVKVFAMHVSTYNTTVDGLQGQWSDAAANDFWVQVPEGAAQEEVDAILRPEAAALATTLAAGRQAAEDELDDGADEVVALLEGEVTDDVLTNLFNAGVLPASAATVFLASRFMAQVDREQRWNNARASGVIPADVYDRVTQAPSDDEAATIVRAWLRSGTRRAALIDELSLLLDMDAVGPTERRLLLGLARYDADKVNSPYHSGGSAQYFVQDVTEGTSRARQINDRLASGDAQLRPLETEYLQWWLGAIGAGTLAALPSRVDQAVSTVPQAPMRDQLLSPVANSIMHLSNPGVGGTDGLAHMPAPIQELASTEIGEMSPRYGRTFSAEMDGDGIVYSIRRGALVVGFADLLRTATVPGGDRFLQELSDHGARIEREGFEIFDNATPAGEPHTVTDVLDEQLGTSWRNNPAIDATRVRIGVDTMVARVQEAGDALQELRASRDTAPAPAEPAPAEPAPAEPAPAEPTPAEPAPSQPAPASPASPEPADAPTRGPGHAWPPHVAPPSDDQPRVLDDPAALLPPDVQQWLSHIDRVARAHGIDPRLLVALIHRVSSFRSDALSPEGAVGLTQLMPDTAGELGVDPHDPVANLEGGARYLRRQLDTFGSVELALAAYNAGPHSVETSSGIPPLDTTRAFVRDVVAIYTALGGNLPRQAV
jgi:soluble lytic murein transglycosylase-like protein